MFSIISIEIHTFSYTFIQLIKKKLSSTVSLYITPSFDFQNIIEVYIILLDVTRRGNELQAIFIQETETCQPLEHNCRIVRIVEKLTLPPKLIKRRDSLLPLIYIHIFICILSTIVTTSKLSSFSLYLSLENFNTND